MSEARDEKDRGNAGYSLVAAERPAQLSSRMRSSTVPSVAILVVIAALPTACQTPYQHAGMTGGYDDFETQSGVHFVSFRGNSETSRDTVIQYWHQRAGEICGGPHRYEVLEEAVKPKSDTVGGDWVTATTVSPGNVGRTTTLRTPAFTFHTSTAEGYIRCFRYSGEEAPIVQPRTTASEVVGSTNRGVFVRRAGGPKGESTDGGSVFRLTPLASTASVSRALGDPEAIGIRKCPDDLPDEPRCRFESRKSCEVTYGLRADKWALLTARCGAKRENTPEVRLQERLTPGMLFHDVLDLLGSPDSSQVRACGTAPSWCYVADYGRCELSFAAEQPESPPSLREWDCRRSPQE